MSMVLKTADIRDDHWRDVASSLGLSQNVLQRFYQEGRSFFGLQCWKEVISKWQEQERFISWDKLAEALCEKYGIDSSQTILELSGGGYLFINMYYVCFPFA